MTTIGADPGVRAHPEGTKHETNGRRCQVLTGWASGRARATTDLAGITKAPGGPGAFVDLVGRNERYDLSSAFWVRKSLATCSIGCCSTATFTPSSVSAWVVSSADTLSSSCWKPLASPTFAR